MRNALLIFIIASALGAFLLTAVLAVFTYSPAKECTHEAAKLGGRGVLVYRDCWAIFPDGRKVKL